jgi:proline iminopeptidase
MVAPDRSERSGTVENHSPYPDIEPYETGWLDVDPPHRLFFERVGRKGGMPAVHLHGGPARGCVPANRRTFDPAFYDLVLFDQRGGGRSTPFGEIAGNDTAALVEDIERLRRHLGFGRWVVSGGSWGALLGLAYTQAYPDSVAGLILRGVTTGADAAIRWWAYDVRNLFPDLWKPFAEFIPEAERDDLVAAYARRITSADPKVWGPAAEAFWEYSTRISSFNTPARAPEATLEQKRTGTLMFFHYVANRFFVKPGQLLDGIARIRDVPCIIVQGRYDVVTRPLNALEVKERWPAADLRWIIGAGHDASEPALMAALTRACEDMKTRIRR